MSEPQTPCTCPRCGYTSVQAPLVVCPQCGARDTRPAGFSLTCGKILVGLAVLSMIAWISAMIYPIAAPILLLLGVLLLARPSLVSVLHRAPGKYFVLPWFSRRSPRVAGAVLVAWSLGSSTVGYASYVGSGSVHVGYQHATASAIARQHLSATAVAEAHARATADTQASATADAQASATAAVEATRSAVVRAHATDTAAAHTRQTAIAVALVQKTASARATVAAHVAQTVKRADAQATAQIVRQARAAAAQATQQAKAASAQATAQAKQSQQLFAQAAVLPSSMSYDSYPSLVVHTLPGADCTASVVYSTGRTPVSFSGVDETAGADGTVSWS